MDDELEELTVGRKINSTQLNIQNCDSYINILSPQAHKYHKPAGLVE
jgi:hypothetical protein